MAVCIWHPDRETRVHCGNCERPICVECMRQHPVGVRCKECARISRLPTYQVSKSYVARGVAAASGMGIAGLLVLTFLPVRGFFFFLIMFGLGFLIAEGVGAAVNRRRGRPYQIMALGGVLIAVAPQVIFALFAFTTGALFALLGAALAAYVAWHRLAP